MSSLWRHLPAWARPTNPVMRYLVYRERNRWGRAGRIAGALSSSAVVLMLFAFSLALYDDGELGPLTMHGESVLYALAYVPLLLVQFGAAATALGLATGLRLAPGDQHAGALDMVRVTSGGAALLIRSRWVAVFYYMAATWLWVTGLRALFALQALADVIASPRVLRDAVNGIRPTVSPGIAGAALGVFALVVVIQPVALAALNAAFSLWLGSVVHSRPVLRTVLGVLLMVEVIVFSVAWVWGLVLIGSDETLWELISIEPFEHWISLAVFALGGDQSLRFLSTGAFVQAWRDVEYGFLLAPLITAVTLLEVLIARLLVADAARRTARPWRE